MINNLCQQSCNVSISVSGYAWHSKQPGAVKASHNTMKVRTVGTPYFVIGHLPSFQSFFFCSIRLPFGIALQSCQNGLPHASKGSNCALVIIELFRYYSTSEEMKLKFAIILIRLTHNIIDYKLLLSEQYRH